MKEAPPNGGGRRRIRRGREERGKGRKEEGGERGACMKWEVEGGGVEERVESRNGDELLQCSKICSISNSLH